MNKSWLSHQCKFPVIEIKDPRQNDGKDDTTVELEYLAREIQSKDKNTNKGGSFVSTQI